MILRIFFFFRLALAEILKKKHFFYKLFHFRLVTHIEGGGQWFCGQFLLLYAYTQMPKGILYVLSILAKIRSNEISCQTFAPEKWSRGCRIFLYYIDELVTRDIDSVTILEFQSDLAII